VSYSTANLLDLGFLASANPMYQDNEPAITSTGFAIPARSATSHNVITSFAGFIAQDRSPSITQGTMIATV
jgi:hypothetical protein